MNHPGAKFLSICGPGRLVCFQNTMVGHTEERHSHSEWEKNGRRKNHWSKASSEHRRAGFKRLEGLRMILCGSQLHPLGRWGPRLAAIPPLSWKKTWVCSWAPLSACFPTVEFQESTLFLHFIPSLSLSVVKKKNTPPTWDILLDQVTKLGPAVQRLPGVEF